jgi:hypothetical protein
MDRTNRVWLTLVAAALAWISLMAAGAVRAANSPPLANTWNISSSGKADSSGALLFRVTPPGEADPVEITVYVLSGANETGVASSIRRALSTQLDASRYNVVAGEGTNVQLTAQRGGPGFSLELVDSDVENVRVSVQSVAPAAPPTVPEQNVPANPPAQPTPPAPGEPVSQPSVPSSPPSGPAPATPSGPADGASTPPASPGTTSPPADSSAPASPGGASNPGSSGSGVPANTPPRGASAPPGSD